MVKIWHAFFRVEENFPLLRKEKRQLPYLPVANWDIAKAINECDQEIIGTIKRHIMHMYIYDTLIPKML